MDARGSQETCCIKRDSPSAWTFDILSLCNITYFCIDILSILLLDKKKIIAKAVPMNLSHRKKNFISLKNYVILSLPLKNLSLSQGNRTLL